MKEDLKQSLKQNQSKTDAVAKTTPQTMERLKSSQVKDILLKYRDQIAQAVPKHLSVDRVIQLSTTLISRTPDLAACSTESLIGAVLQCSILGFEPVASLGQAYLIPFSNTKNGKKEVQFIIGYQGLIDLVMRSDRIMEIYAECVYENDEFNYELGLERKLRHIPAHGDRGNIEYVYAVAKYVNGGKAFVVMSKDEVNVIKNKSQAGKSAYSPWNSGYYDAMAKKTALRQLTKYLPKSIEYREVADEAVIHHTAFTQGDLNLGEVEVDIAEIVKEKSAEELFNEINDFRNSNPDRFKVIMEMNNFKTDAELFAHNGNYLQGFLNDLKMA